MCREILGKKFERRKFWEINLVSKFLTPTIFLSQFWLQDFFFRTIFTLFFLLDFHPRILLSNVFGLALVQKDFKNKF